MSTTLPSPETAILDRLLQPKRPTLSAEAARAILAIEFPPEDRERMDILAEKARAGTLSPAEEAEIDGYERVGLFLSLMKSKARQSLRAAGAP